MKVFCLLSDHRASRSLSPRMHNAVLRRLGWDAAYVSFAVPAEGLPAAVEGLRALGVAGVNVTVPHKEAVASLLDGLSDQARRLGAVNTIVRRDGRLEGHNTDLGGVCDVLARARLEMAGGEALVTGAGGAARAVAAALQDLGAARVWICGRTPERAQRLAAEVGGEPLPLTRAGQAASRVRLLVNATSVSEPAEAPELARLVEGLKISPRCRLVWDLNYGRQENFWQALARRHGVAFQDGLTLLACQGRRSLELWTGRRVPLDWFLEGLGAAS